MEDYPSNSRRAKTENVSDEIEPKRIEKVVTGKVIRRKKPLGKRLTEMFFGGESREVGHYVLADVLIPAVKELFADVVMQAIERKLFGDSRPNSRRSGGFRPGRPTHVSYNQFSSSTPTTPWRRDRDDSRTISRSARASHNFDEIIMDSRQEAETVLERMYDLLERYESVSVADFYELVGITANHAEDRYGWMSLRGSSVVRTRGGGYQLEFPPTEPLEP